MRKDIRSAWAADGEGATRLDAATVLPDDLATNFLEIIAQDEDAAADHRGQAYGRLAYRTSAGCGITRRALQDLAERDRPADVDLILAIGHHISAQLADDRDPPPELIPDALALTGVSGAALAYVLACAYLGGALERSDRIRKAALDPINSLPGDTPTALPRWAAYAKVLDAFYAAAKPRTAPAPTVSVPSTDELRVALMSVDRITRDLAANSEGGLSVAEPKDTGGLTLLRSPPPEAD